MRLERTSIAEWGSLLPDRGFEVFHTPAALSVVDDHADGHLELYVGYRGEEPVALFPTVSRSFPGGRAFTSPPPGMAIQTLGPIMRYSSPKRRKREKLHLEFTEAILREVDLTDPRRVLRVVCPPAFSDPRHFVWHDLELETRFTYRLDVDGRSVDDLLASMSKSLRREIRATEDGDVTVHREGLEGAYEVFQDTELRYRKQGESFPLSWDYVEQLITALDGTDRFRVYVARAPDGGFLSGITVLYSNDVAYFWQGGVRTSYDGVAVNSAIHWRIIEDLVEDPPRSSIRAYDLMGANTERICRYKSKFGADLVPYYVIESGGVHMDVLKAAYRILAR